MSGWGNWLKARYKSGSLGKSTLLGTISLGMRAVIQTTYLLLVSRWLGAEGYGLFAGSVALVILGAPLANWGSSLLITRYIAENRNSSRAIWATSLVQTGVIGSLLVLGILIISGLLLEQRLLLGPMLLLALSELILLPAAQAATSQCYALERATASAVSICLVPLGRVLVMIAAIAGGAAGNPEHAATTHFMGSALGFIGAFGLVTLVDGLPAWRSRLSLRDATRQGAAYSVSNMTGVSYQEVDKILMLQLLGAALAGPYTVAFRVASIFILPISALISAVLPRLMKQHEKSESAKTHRKVLLAASGYGIFAGIVMAITAPAVPFLFGQGYEETAYYLLLLTPWPLLFALRQNLATKLTAAGHQNLRLAVDVMGLALISVLILIFLPNIGVTAAIASLLATESVTSLALLALIHRNRNTCQ